MMAQLPTVFVVPRHTFFYWGFTLPKRVYQDFIKMFRLGHGKQVRRITLTIRNKKYSARVRMIRIKTPRFPNRNVVQIFYEHEYDTLKALRKLFIYSYASTISKRKPQLKELFELVHSGKDTFKIKVVSQQKTDFDQMHQFLEDKNLFEFWKTRKIRKRKYFFVDFARKWLPASELKLFTRRANVIYLLYHSRKRQLYVGKANRLGGRVKVGQGRIGLAHDWDKFMFFEIHPEFSSFIEQIETFTIRSIASLLQNHVGSEPIGADRITLVNRSLRTH